MSMQQNVASWKNLIGSQVRVYNDKTEISSSYTDGRLLTVGDDSVVCLVITAQGANLGRVFARDAVFIEKIFGETS